MLGQTSRVNYSTRFKAALGSLILLLVGLWVALPPPIGKLDNVSPQLFDRNGTLLSSYTVDDGLWRVHTPLEDIDPRFIAALIAVEDERFWHHSGVDILSILRATRTFIRSGEAKSGASTITMQLVRQIEPRERVLSSKIFESARALQYNLRLSKTEILEQYLTHISYGGNIHGLGAATQIYFGKSPKYLTWSEIAALIALPQAPASRRPRPSDHLSLITGRNKVLDKLVRQKVITETQAAEAKQDRLNLNFSRLPTTGDAAIASLAKSLKKQKNKTTSLDAKMQSMLHGVFKGHTSAWPQEVNGSAIIVHNQTREVRALIGAASVSRDGGWMDLTRIKRSPGSTLKPFIYGLAMDEGLIDASTQLSDLPQNFNGYEPENFNRIYHGDVRVHEALRHSLNIPAVAVMQQLGAPRFEAMLRDSYINPQRANPKREEAGLAIALGGVGLTALDLATLYTGLANGGEVVPLVWQTSDTPKNPRYMFSQETAEELTQILRYAPSPNGSLPHWVKENGNPVAYKTGTSYGYRDVWAVGYTPEWTVVIWVGRPDGGVMPNQTGRKVAAPIMFDVFDQLPNNGSEFGYFKTADASAGLQKMIDKTPAVSGPEFIFPVDGAVILDPQKGRGVNVTLRQMSKLSSLYVNGEPIAPMGDSWIWKPSSSGFYKLTGLDDQGQSQTISVRIVSNAL